MNDSNAFATLGKVHNRSGADVAAVQYYYWCSSLSHPITKI